MGKREYIPAFFSYRRTLKVLTDEQMGKVFRAALLYAETGVEPELDPLEMMGFAFMREDIDRASAEYDRRCESNKNSAKHRWSQDEDANGCERMQTDANATCVSEEMQSDAKDAKAKAKANAKAKDKANGIESVVAPTVAPTESPKKTMPPSVEEVDEYIQSKGYNVDAEKFVAYYSAQGWKLSNGLPMKDWKACCKTWHIRNNENPPRAAPTSKSGDPLMDYLDKVINGDE